MTDDNLRFYRINRAADDEFYFTQVARNGEIVATSEMYPTREHAERGALGAGGEGAVILAEHER